MYAAQDLAESLLDGTTEESSNVRLFNSFFHVRVAGGSPGAATVATQPGVANAPAAVKLVKHKPRERTLSESHQLKTDSRAASGNRLLNIAPNVTRVRKPKLATRAAPKPAETTEEKMAKQAAEIARAAHETHQKNLERGVGLKVLAKEDFSDGLDNGWSAVIPDRDNGFQTSKMLLVTATNGSLTATDGANSGTVWYWKAPKADAAGNAILGNMESLVGGTLSFDMGQSALGENRILPSELDGSSLSEAVKKYETYGDVILRGGLPNSKRTAVFYMNRDSLTDRTPGISAGEEQQTPTTYSIRMAPITGDPGVGGPWVETGQAFDQDAQQDTLVDILSHLDLLLIRGRFQTGLETSAISKIIFKGCPIRCNNGGKLIRDRCICECKRGFIGEKCSQRVQFDVESLSDKGEGSGKCLTVCRPKLKTTVSGQEAELNCNPRHNSVYYPSAVPIVMITTCRGDTNQLFYVGEQSPNSKTVSYESVGLRGYCLGANNPGITRSLKDIHWGNNSFKPLTLVMCSKVNSDNIWNLKHTTGLPEYTRRLMLSTATNSSQTFCMSPHASWDSTCMDPRCLPVGSGSNSQRQAVLRNCDNNALTNRFYVRNSRYVLLREGVPTIDPAIAASNLQSKGTNASTHAANLQRIEAENVEMRKELKLLLQKAEARKAKKQTS